MEGGRWQGWGPTAIRWEGGYYSNRCDTSTGATAGLGGLLLVIGLNASQHQSGAAKPLSCIWSEHLKMKAKHIWRQSADSPLQSLPWKQQLYPWDLPPDAPRKVFFAELERVPLPSDCTFVKASLIHLKVRGSAFVNPKHGLVSISALWSLTVKLHFWSFFLL